MVEGGSDHVVPPNVSSADGIDGQGEVKLLAEIVGCFKVGDEEISGSINNEIKPYCIVRMGGTIIHKTKKGEGGRNCVWTVSTRSTFLIQATPKDLALEALDISVWSKQKDPFNLTVLAVQFLGKIKVDLAEVVLSHCDEQRLELQLTKEDGSKSNGTLAVRFRFATRSDERFLAALNGCPELPQQPTGPQRESLLGRQSTTDAQKLSTLLVTEADEAQMVGETFMNAISGAFKSRKYYDSKIGQNKVRVKPGPDPERKAETTYLTKEQLVAEAESPSQQWIEAGSGRLGKLYLEVLSCHDLPNVDVGEAVGNVTDAFVCAVYEDCMVQTPVIDDELSPYFMPWTARAFVFNIMHPASMLYLAAFDYDLGVSDHEALGRAVVNIANFQCNTDYTLFYKLYPSTNVTDRIALGTIKIRLRIEYYSEKAVLRAALHPRPKFHINVQKEKSLKVLRYTCFGEYGDDSEQPFDLTVLRSYVNEILGYKKAVSYCFGDAIRSLVFWRGQVHVCKDLDIPLHSFLFFWLATTLVEKPFLAPPFFLLSIAWFMIATQTLRRQHPSPWSRCHSLWHYIEILRSGESTPAFYSVRVNQGEKEALEYEKAWQDRLEKDEQLAATEFALQEKIDKMGDEAIHTKFTGGIPLDLITRLTRYQGILGRLCMKFRLVKIVVTWEESYLSFWITACFLTAGLVSLLLPWSFICLWVGRILVWGLFGPHMKLLDLHLQAQGKDEDAIEQALENFKHRSHFAIARRQEAVKLRDLKLLTFGPYSSLVPSFNLSRHYDRPLATSSALYQHPRTSDFELAPVKIPGQQFFGTILPRIQSEAYVYEKEIADIRRSELDIQASIKSITVNENDTYATCKNNVTMPDEAGFELVSAIGVQGPPGSKDFHLSDTTSISLNPESKVAIVRSEMKASSNRRRSSTFRGGIELIKYHEDDDDILVGDSQAVFPNRDIAICEIDKQCLQGTKAMTNTFSVEEKSLPADEERETGEVEVVLGDPTIRDDLSFGKDASVGHDGRTSVDVEIDSNVSWTVYYTPSIIS